MKHVNRKVAADGNEALDKCFRDIEAWMTNMENFVGFAPSRTAAAASQVVVAPDTPILDVTGANGTFSITIQPKTPTTTLLFFEVQYSATLPFEVSEDVTSVPITTQSSITLHLPGVTAYFRAHARLANGVWSAWVYTPAAVAAG